MVNRFFKVFGISAISFLLFTPFVYATNAIGDIFPTLTNNIGGILENNILRVIELFGALLGLGILIFYTVKWIGGKSVFPNSMPTWREVEKKAKRGKLPF